MRKTLPLLLSTLMVMGTCAFAVAAEPADVEAAAPAQAQTVEAIEISDAAGLAAIADDLAGSYVLTADIDLEGAEWTPLGTFASLGEDPEEQELPNPAYAFTGTFDGAGHTISNFVIDQPDSMVLGIFGCMSDAVVRDLVVENVSITGGPMSSAVVGYAFCSLVENVTLTGQNTITVSDVDLGMDDVMVGGIVAAGMGSTIVDCSAAVDIVAGDAVNNIGIVGGGLEATSVINCTASGTITVGDDCFGLGGISGCGFAAEEFTDCVAEDVAISAGKNTTWVGGITGYAGGYEDESWSMPVTVFSGCDASGVTFDLGDGSEEPGEIVGAGFYSEEAAEMLGSPFDAPSVYVIL